MKIVQTNDVPKTGSPNVRGGAGHRSQIIFDSDTLGRDPMRSDNFFMQISFLEPGDFHSPRHRHNFEQFRYVITGEGDYPEGVMTDGTLGYFPEGVFYGPQERLFGTIVILQFGGPSGSGFVDRKQMKAAFEAIKAQDIGEFRDGTFYRKPGVEGPPQQDGNELMIEHFRGRRIVYPEAQYATPVLVHSNAFPWTAMPEVAGASKKSLGTFSSAEIEAARYRLAPGTSLPVTGRGTYLVLSGSGTLGSEQFRQYTALYLEEGESASFTASDAADILAIGLPAMRHIAAVPPGVSA